jgi:hypothetical protein
MKLLKNIKILIAVFAVMLAFVKAGNAQCSGPVKAGIKKLAPYTHTGPVSNVTLVLGSPSEIHLSFYKGLSYKLQVCADPAAGKVNFRVIDENNTELFNSKNEKDANSWEFFSNSTQELVIELVTEDENKQGCAAIVVGMKAPVKQNSIRNL